MAIRIAIDSMSGDLGLRASLPAVQQVLTHYPLLEIVLVGDESSILESLPDSLMGDSRLCIQHASEVVAMDEKPSQALRHKKDSSMRVAIDLLADKRVDAVVSAGNTGALMAMGYYCLKTLPNIERPAICAVLPAAERRYMLDLGANVDSSAEHLRQFALMAAARCQVLDGVAEPRVALLNIGSESSKGNEQVKLAAELLIADQNVNYVGFIEADALFTGDFDVLVCDGFVGNVALKACEGTAAYVTRLIKSVFSGARLRLLGWLLRPLLQRVFQQVNPRQYNGASFLGLNGVVVKSHGNSSVEGFQRAIEQAIYEVEADMITAIADRLNHTQSLN